MAEKLNWLGIEEDHNLKSAWWSVLSKIIAGLGFNGSKVSGYPILNANLPFLISRYVHSFFSLILIAFTLKNLVLNKKNVTLTRKIFSFYLNFENWIFKI